MCCGAEAAAVAVCRLHRARSEWTGTSVLGRAPEPVSGPDQVASVQPMPRGRSLYENRPLILVASRI